MRIYIVIAKYNREDSSLDNAEIVGIFRHKSKALRICDKFAGEQELLRNTEEPVSPTESYDWRNPSDEWINYFDNHASWEEHQEYEDCNVIEQELNGER